MTGRYYPAIRYPLRRPGTVLAGLCSHRGKGRLESQKGLPVMCGSVSSPATYAIYLLRTDLSLPVFLLLFRRFRRVSSPTRPGDRPQGSGGGRSGVGRKVQVNAFAQAQQVSLGNQVRPVRLAGVGYDPSWHHKRQWMSPGYTTKWTGILKVT